MSRVRVLVGTRKGAFILTSDGKRDRWQVDGPHFGGWEIFHVKGSPVNPDRVYASQTSDWFGQVIQRSDDGGRTWEPVGNDFQYEGVPGTHQWYDGTPHPWEFLRVWHLEPSPTEAETVYAGVEDAALFRSTDGGHNWQEVAGLRRHGTGPQWQPGAGGLCLHTILLDPADPRRMYVAISAAGTFRTTDGGETWTRVPGDVPVGGGRGMAILPDGALVRGSWASDVNDAGCVRRSTDGGKTWSDPIYFVPPRQYRAWPTIIRSLRDGRLVLMAGVWKRGEGDVPNPRMTKMMFVSADGGQTWGEGLALMPTEAGVCEESDFCELPSGDLFFVHRVEHFPTEAAQVPPGAARMGEPFPNGYSDRMQSVVYAWRGGFRPGPVMPAPFPHSGFPEVMLAAEDVILHFATDGIYWTADVGATWTRLPIPGSSYYPRAVQLPDGRIICIGHVGSDDVYGTVDQSIRQQSFRLRVTPRAVDAR